MAPVIVLLIVVVVAVVLLRSPSLRRPRQLRGATPSSDRRRHPSARSHAPIDRERLALHVRKLHEAVDQRLISDEEAIASIVRQTDGQLSAEAARQLLRRLDV